jgi:hypothetical protein
MEQHPDLVEHGHRAPDRARDHEARENRGAVAPAGERGIRIGNDEHNDQDACERRGGARGDADEQTAADREAELLPALPLDLPPCS